MVGAGRLKFSVQKVLTAFLDACSLFRMKDSTLRRVYMLVWEKDKETEKVSHGCAIKIKSHTPKNPKP